MGVGSVGLTFSSARLTEIYVTLGEHCLALDTFLKSIGIFKFRIMVWTEPQLGMIHEDWHRLLGVWKRWEEYGYGCQKSEKP